METISEKIDNYSVLFLSKNLSWSSASRYIEITAFTLYSLMSVEQIYTLMSLYLNICLLAVTGCQQVVQQAWKGNCNITRNELHEPMKRRELKVYG